LGKKMYIPILWPSPPQYIHPLLPVISMSSDKCSCDVLMLDIKAGMLWFASSNTCFKSNREVADCSGPTNVVVNPVFPPLPVLNFQVQILKQKWDVPVRPIRWI